MFGEGTKCGRPGAHFSDAESFRWHDGAAKRNGRLHEVGSHWNSAGHFPCSTCYSQLDEIRRRAEAICADFDLTRLQDRPADKLTAGQRRTVELARALASEPELLLLDEPSSGLSTEETARLEQCIRTLQTKGVSVLLVSHDMGLMGVAQTVSVLYFGKIIAHGSMEEIRRHERVRQVYLGGEKC